MDGQNRNLLAVSEALYAKVLGAQALNFLKSNEPQTLAELADHEAMVLLEKVRGILDDSRLDDPECFQKIEALVDAFSEAGISVARHDW